VGFPEDGVSGGERGLSLLASEGEKRIIHHQMEHCPISKGKEQKEIRGRGGGKGTAERSGFAFEKSQSINSNRGLRDQKVGKSRTDHDKKGSKVQEKKIEINH